ncbi:MAG: sulfotransferase family protein [Xanthomonadales bacterium]|nr:sulfotransferase family protein [Xanthomonadales bacterium]
MNTSEETPNADIGTALKHATSLLNQNPGLAEQQAVEILKVYSRNEPAMRILAAALRRQGKPRKALAVLEPLAARNSDSPSFLFEYGQSLGAVGQGDKAIAALRKSVRLDSKHAGAWRALGDQLAVSGDEAGSRAAYERHYALSVRHPELVEAIDLVRDGKLAKAERLTKDFLMQHPADVSAMRILADIALKLDQLKDAGHLLERCLQLAPDFHLARHSYAVALLRQQKLEEAHAQISQLLAREPNNPGFLVLKGSVLVRRGDHEEALAIFEKILKNYPKQAGAQMNYGHTLKSVGRLEEAIAAYRRCIALSPTIGEAYWSLANLKTFRFGDADIELMRSQVTSEGGDADDQAHIAFALGKALEDRKEYDESFRFYKRGNAIRRIKHRHNPRINVFDTARQIKALDSAFCAARTGQGCPAPDPIFIVGLPRSGSTLLEQILASHSLVDGTAELTDIIAIARKLGQKSKQNPASCYPEILRDLPADKFRELGESYLQTTRIQRGDQPYFIDKLPNNFQHIGLIHLILPNAKIIDARRHPMACCFSNFKQLFARGQTFTYDLEGMGRYYRDYIILMDHWDQVLPGRVLRVQYEDMVADTEGQVRRLLEHCGLPFEEQCLRFYETERAIRTPSAEQVRQPIYQGGLEQWRNFESHLGPLKEALGPLLQRYPIE